MAISREQKKDQVDVLTQLFDDSRLAATARYTGLSVHNLQELRKSARQAGVIIKIAKNRLARVALKGSKKHSGSDTSLLQGQLLYAFSADDEVAPAQLLATYAKTHDALQLVSGYDGDGNVLDTAAITELSLLPSKDSLRGMFVGILSAPLGGFMAVSAGTQSSFARVLAARSEAVT